MEVPTADGVSAPLPGRCAFYVEKKKRYCKMIVGSGKAYCGEHANALFYVQDINAGPAIVEDTPKDEVPLSDRSKAELNLLIKKLKTAVKGFKCKHEENIQSHPALHEALNDPKNGDSAFKHLKQQASLLGNMEDLHLLGPNRCFVEFGAGKGKLSHWIHVALKAYDDIHFLLVERSSARFKVDGKHQNSDTKFERLQVDIQHLDLRKVPLLQEKGLPVVGVGKHLCGAATDLALQCLLGSSETAPHGIKDQPPSKRSKLQQQPGESTGPELQPIPRVAGETAAGQELRVGGVAIALCCHHRCDWRHYVGKEFFKEKGLGASEFAAFLRMSSWATCGSRQARQTSPPQGQTDQTFEEEEHEATEEAELDSLEGVLNAEDREHIGRLCKLLIDQGRVHFLQQKGFDSRLLYYTSSDVSLENVLLTALPALR
uniref:tRNA:m(4)X modification enzyme TRM13 n=1 Tax=Oncorhynchus tshawytscha TaxID=74940 RepID=A0A8C8H462_ONCTS